MRRIKRLSAVLTALMAILLIQESRKQGEYKKSFSKECSSEQVVIQKGKYKQPLADIQKKEHQIQEETFELEKKENRKSVQAVQKAIDFNCDTNCPRNTMIDFDLMLPAKNLSAFPVIPFSLTYPATKKKDWLKPTIETFGINALVWIYDWHIQKRAWANISIDSIIKNINKGYAWDNNGFQCNQIEHPFHGSMYFAAARTNGLNFWESIIFPFLGSFTWEVALENERPSTNDQIMSSFGGIALGEALFRLSDLIANEESGGIERGARETLTFIVNPVVGSNRLITGKTFRMGSNSEKHYYDLRFSIGASDVHNFLTGIDLEYKDAIEDEKPKINPYDYFRFEFKIKLNNNGLKNEKILTSGLLFGKKIKILSSEDNLVGLFSVFDYISIPTNRVSTIGLGPGIVGNFNFGSDLFLNTFGVLSGIFGGSTSSFALKYGKNIFVENGESHHFGPENNPYYLGPGIAGKLNLELGKKGLGSIQVNLSQYWIHSMFVVNANEYITRLCPRINLNITKWLQIRFENEFYFKKGTYKNYPSIWNKNCYFRTFCIVRF